jgi:hypothetical protein
MNKLFTFLFTMMFLIIGCSDNNPITGGVDPEPELLGCEAATTYDWDSIEFETSLEGGADTWIAFSLEELTLFTVVINQAGFQCTVYNGCEGEVGLDPPLFQFETIGNGFEVGIVPDGEYWVKILNTRPNRLDFTFRIELDDIVYGCTDDDAGNYNSEANVDDGSCILTDCTTEYWVTNYGEMVNDCDGNCAPVDWIADGYCDDGAYGVYDEEGNQVPVNLWCEEYNFDEGDCEVIPGECTPGLIEDCNGICAPAGWLGDGFCDDGSYEYNGNPIFFNCEEFNNDNGDCNAQGRTTETRQLPNGKIKIEN